MLENYEDCPGWYDDDEGRIWYKNLSPEVKEWVDEADHICDELIQTGPVSSIGFDCDKKIINIECRLDSAKWMLGLVQLVDDYISEKVANELLEEEVPEIAEIRKNAQTEIAVIRKFMNIDGDTVGMFELDDEFDKKFSAEYERLRSTYPNR